MGLVLSTPGFNTLPPPLVWIASVVIGKVACRLFGYAFNLTTAKLLDRWAAGVQNTLSSSNTMDYCCRLIVVRRVIPIGTSTSQTFDPHGKIHEVATGRSKSILSALQNIKSCVLDRPGLSMPCVRLPELRGHKLNYLPHVKRLKVG